MTMWLTDPRADCPRCGETVDRVHDHDCDGELPFEGRCPMCGEDFESYMTHIQFCEGGGSAP